MSALELFGWEVLEELSLSSGLVPAVVVIIGAVETAVVVAAGLFGVQDVKIAAPIIIIIAFFKILFLPNFTFSFMSHHL